MAVKMTKQQLEARNFELSEENGLLRFKVTQLEGQVRQRVDDRMLEQRRALCNSLGQMIEATSKAVMFIVGKEVI